MGTRPAKATQGPMVIPPGAIVLVVPRWAAYTLVVVWLGVLALVHKLTSTVTEIGERYVEYTEVFEKLSVLWQNWVRAKAPQNFTDTFGFVDAYLAGHELEKGEL